MNIHEAARRIMEMPELPRTLGLCGTLSDTADPSCGDGWKGVYGECTRFMYDLGPDHPCYLPERGVWTEQRLNAICLLAASDAEDFEQVGPTEVEMLFAAGFTPEEAADAVEARIESPWGKGPWNGVEVVSGWLLDAFDWDDNGGFMRWDSLYERLP